MPWASLVAQLVKSLLANTRAAGDVGLIPGSGRSPGGGNDNPLQYSCLENSMDRGTWGSYSPWGLKESYITVDLKNSHSLEVDHYVLFGGNF